MGLLWSLIVYCLLPLFLACLPNSTTLASVIRQCYQNQSEAPCTKTEQSAIDCIVSSINDSRDQMDITVRITTKIGAWKSSRARFCAEWSKIKEEVNPCEKKQILCSTKTKDICGRNAARCAYLKYATCRIKAGMIKGKSLHELQSKLCVETDLNRGLLPDYGPHLQCYDNSRNYSGDIDFPLDHYLQFCQQFNYDQLKICIEARLAPLTSDQLLTDKAEFIRAARKLLHKTNHFCNALSKINDSSLTECRMKNVQMCNKEAFNRAKEETYPPRWGYYIPCISQQYAKCHTSIGAIINETLLMDFASSGFTTILPCSLALMLIFFSHIFIAEIRS